MSTRVFSILAVLAVLLGSCTKGDDDPAPAAPDEGPRLIMKFRFDSTQVRLNAVGQPSTVQAGHGAQSPVFNKMSAHYVEFAPTALTALGTGDVVYHASETTLGGSTAIDHDLCLSVGNNEAFLDIPLSELSPGTYEWLRVSLAYQNYNIRFAASTLALTGTIASFIGYNTYIGSFQVADSTIQVNANKLQGYWAFEVNDPPLPVPVTEGQAPATTVVNPLFATSPIPSGSCVVTSAFPVPLTITGNETEDVVVVVSVSTNKSFEWVETDADNVYEPVDGETVVDMGVRGMIPIVQ
ncbi:MAG TPA: hypothetical protein PLB89_03190 [Flavobacteriales bacterium]|nr:hypothetical protein [Flavobacteriales bacterium]